MKIWPKALPTLLTMMSVAAQTDVRMATVEGTVKNLLTGEPLADVRIVLATEQPPIGTISSTRTTTTDVDGKFSITAISPGRYGVTAARTLFFRPRRDSGPAMLALGEGQRLTGVQILLSPTSVIAGRILDDKREPLRSVRVDALRREFREGLWIWAAAAQSTTDDRGEYRLFNLLPGTYYVRATQASNAPLYYPGSLDSQTAVAVSVDVGSEAGAIDIEMRRIPEYSVQLKLGGVPPGSSANFQIRRKHGLANEQQAARSETVSENTYRILRVAEGAYDLFVQVYSVPAGVGGLQSRFLSNAASIPVVITNANQDLGTVGVPPTVTVTGRIASPEPLPSPLAFDRLIFTMRALDLAAPIAAIARGNTTPPGINSDGSFTLPSVAPGRYQVQLSGLPVNTFLISAREGTRDVLDTGFTVTGTQNLLELTVGGPGTVGSVIGTVVNASGLPVSSSTVVLVPAPERRNNPAAFRATTTDQSGNFVVRSVLAGDYRILGWEDVEPGTYLDPEFLKGFETHGEAIKVQRGSQHTVTVRVIPGN